MTTRPPCDFSRDGRHHYPRMTDRHYWKTTRGIWGRAYYFRTRCTICKAPVTVRIWPARRQVQIQELG